jgi:hypothetical protein
MSKQEIDDRGRISTNAAVWWPPAGCLRHTVLTRFLYKLFLHENHSWELGLYTDLRNLDLVQQWKVLYWTLLKPSSPRIHGEGVCRSGGTVPLIFHLDTMRDEWSALRSGRFITSKKPWHPLHMRLTESQNQHEWFGKEINILPVPRIDPRSIGCPARSLVTILTELSRLHPSYPLHICERSNASFGATREFSSNKSKQQAVCLKLMHMPASVAVLYKHYSLSVSSYIDSRTRSDIRCCFYRRVCKITKSGY